MFKDLRLHKSDYCLLGAVTTLYLILFLYKKIDAQYLFWLTSAYGLSYLLWGIYHQSRIGQFTFWIMLEYLLVVIFGIVIVSTLLL